MFQQKGLQHVLKLCRHNVLMSNQASLSGVSSKLPARFTAKTSPQLLLTKRNKSDQIDAKQEDGWIWEDKEAQAKVTAEFQDYMDRRYQESVKDKRSRLLWQSRKRGITENCLLFATFYQKYGDELTDKDLQDYDNLLNDYNNEWDIYYWMVKTREVPAAYQTNVMSMLQVHAENQNKEKRLVQPELRYDAEEKIYK